MNTNRKSLSCLGLVVGLAVPLAACGGGASLDSSSSIQATAAALSASQMTESQLSTGIRGGQPTGVQVTATGGIFTASGTLDNPAGGSLSVDAQGTYGNDGSVNYAAHMTFMNWRAAGQNVVLNGTLVDQLTTTVSGSTSTVDAKYTGGLTLSGAISGMVDYDLTLHATTSSSGACVTESGSVGGYGIDIKSGC